jgi:AcrR family transcriptional regulator
MDAVTATGLSRAAEPAGEGHAAAPTRRGRPRSERVHRAILDAARELLAEGGFGALRLEHVAARAGVGKATIYRRWHSKEALALDLMLELASPNIPVADTGDTGAELTAVVLNPIRALTATPFGPVLRALLSEIALNPELGDPFRATVVGARREAVARVISRGVSRGDLRPDTDPEIATELLVGPVYFRLMFGGPLNADFAARVVQAFLKGHAPH